MSDNHLGVPALAFSDVQMDNHVIVLHCSVNESGKSIALDPKSPKHNTDAPILSQV